MTSFTVIFVTDTVCATKLHGMGANRPSVVALPMLPAENFSCPWMGFNTPSLFTRMWLARRLLFVNGPFGGVDRVARITDGTQVIGEPFFRGFPEKRLFFLCFKYG